MGQNKHTDQGEDFSVWPQGFGAEQTRAINRILETHDGAIGWLLNFISINLDSLGAGGWSDLGHEVSAFAKLGHRLIASQGALEVVRGKKPEHMRGYENAHLVLGLGWDDMTEEERLESRALPSQKTVRFLQVFCRERLDSFTRDGWVSIPNPQSSTQITKYNAWIVADSGEDAFKGHFTEILKSERSHLKKCKECETFFLGYRKDKLFCSVRCLGRDKIRRYRNAQPEQKTLIVKRPLKKPRGPVKRKTKPQKK